MSTLENDPEPVQIRRTIRKRTEAAEIVTRETLIDGVATDVGVRREAVADELDALEADGFVYLVPHGEGEEVRLT